MNLSILYRGPLASCNYGCGYCPFAKRKDTAADLRADRDALCRFVNWVASRTTDTLSVLFTPWGEALGRKWYRDALVQLTHTPHISRAAIQTNLACSLDWVGSCDPTKLALWCTYHPTETSRRRFLTKCLELDRRGIRFSVGAVGVKEHREEIRALRRELPKHVYLWVNAYRPRHDYYSDEDIAGIEAIDPLFRINVGGHASFGRECRAGETAVSIDGEGTIRRCHFIREPIGNIYHPGIDIALQPRLCTRSVCRCYIGYVHLKELGLDRIFGDGILERIPAAELGISKESSLKD